jgi:hypothetical protein
MITTGQPNLDGIITELEAIVLGMVEGNALKAGDIATLKAENADLKKQVEELKKLVPSQSPQTEQP